MTDIMDLIKFEDVLMIALGFTVVIFLPYLHIVLNKQLRDSTPRWMRRMIFFELAAGLLLMFAFAYFLVGGKVQDTVEGLVSNKNEHIDSNKTVNLDVPVMLLSQDSSEFDGWEPALARWGMDAIMRLEAKVTTHKDKELHLPPGTKLLKLFTDEGFASRGDAFIMLLSVDENPNMLVIVCRGTDSDAEWLEDLDYGLSPAGLLGSNGIDYYRDVMIHTGFLKVYLNMRADVMEEIKNYPVKPLDVFITGHSSGAAVAAIMGTDIMTNAGNVENVLAYVFGCPRPGNTVFKNYVDTLSGLSIHRITNTSDVIPQFPPPIAPNIGEPGNPYPYSHVGILHPFSDNRHSMNANHFLSTYQDWLEREAEKIEKQNN